MPGRDVGFNLRGSRENLKCTDIFRIDAHLLSRYSIPRVYDIRRHEFRVGYFDHGVVVEDEGEREITAGITRQVSYSIQQLHTHALVDALDGVTGEVQN